MHHVCFKESLPVAQLYFTFPLSLPPLSLTHWPPQLSHHDGGKVLKARQEREESRTAVKARDASELTQQREQLEQQIQEMERHVESTATAGRAEEAQQALNTLRTLIQDTSSCALLTAYGMAKANKSLSRLQQLVDEQSAGQGGPRKFKFSARAKAKAEEVRPAAEAAPAAAGAPAEGLPAAPQGKVYGGVQHQTLCIPAAKAIFVRDCASCTILCLPTAGSAFLTNCVDCTVYVCCHQLRLKDCHNVQVYVWCTSTPIIETCDGMGFGPYACWRGLLSSTMDGVRAASHEEWAQSVGDVQDVERAKTAYTTIDDFQWIKKTQSPHWRVMEEETWVHVDEPFCAAAVHQHVD
ncbi:tubulin-specific chaperone C [Strigomonas culicis]|uniref:Tubulin-specific chaperone C n=1 Tax=Strigomonas culicis TaxID=28005 RepID=S9UGD8_9TRYP|nr:tubulin-specific chaperone C [Strigomonas culicis]|eukprot:EPY27814.1 tubulin-specific chaperone C [Strigomonas culicis]